jgi:putative ABC transport system permease protein
VFSLIQGVLLTSPPYRQPERLALVHSLSADGQPSRQGWAALQWTDWQKEGKPLEGVAAYDWTFNFLIGNDGSESMQGMVVTLRVFQHYRAPADSREVFRRGRGRRQDSARSADRLRSLAA